MTTAAEIHISDVLAFKRCRRYWDFTSLLRMNLTPLGTYVPFFVGSAVHYCLEQHYKYGTAPTDSLAAFLTEYAAKVGSEAIARDMEAIGTSLILVEGVLAHYLEWATADKSDFADNALEWVSTEQAFKSPIRTAGGRVSKRMYLAGRFDGVVRHKRDNQLYLWEIKTTRSVTERLKMLPHEEQANAYANAAQELLGEPIAGIIYTIIRKKVPESPAELKKGGLSRDKSIDTTAERYLAAVRAHHGEQATREFIKTQYGEILQQLLDQPNKFFARVVIRRTQAELRRANDDLRAVATDMINRPYIYPHGGPHCTWCNFREPCIAMNNGDFDTAKALLVANYQRNTYHERRADDV